MSTGNEIDPLEPVPICVCCETTNATLLMRLKCYNPMANGDG